METRRGVRNWASPGAQLVDANGNGRTDLMGVKRGDEAF
jgi:hypothetical protein